MGRPKRRRHREAYRAWIKWTPVLVILFSVLAFDTWLNTVRRSNDYEQWELDRQLRQLEKALIAIRIEAAGLENLDRLEEEAPELALVKPDPDQICLVYYNAGLRPDAGLPSMPIAGHPRRLPRRVAVELPAPEPLDDNPLPLAVATPVFALAESEAALLPDEAELGRLDGVVPAAAPVNLDDSIASLLGTL